METVAAKITDCSQCFSFIKSIHSLRGIFHHFQVICNVIILPVSYFGAYLLIQQYGMQGGSISLAVSYLIEIGALWFWLLRKIKQREKQHMEQ